MVNQTSRERNFRSTIIFSHGTLSLVVVRLEHVSMAPFGVECFHSPECLLPQRLLSLSRS